MKNPWLELRFLRRKTSSCLLFAAWFVAIAAMGCSDGDLSTTSFDAPDQGVRVLRTRYGIPHIIANNWRDLGLGYGYAYAQDNFCVLMKEIVSANGQSARYFGEDGNLKIDFLMRRYNTDEFIEEEFLRGVPQNLLDLTAGYAAGMNRHLREQGTENLPGGSEGCQGAPWVREITATDLAKVRRSLLLRASSRIDQVVDAIFAAEPPRMSSNDTPTAQQMAVERQSVQFAENTFRFYEPTEMGSNAYAVGRDASQTGHGMLLGNPHFPWSGPERFYMAHLTVPGEYDVMGASLHGIPLINIGFNKNIAWTHTVSMGRRFTGFELQLVDGDPMRYLVDGEARDITATNVEAEFLNADGNLETRRETIYESEYGPILELGEFNELLDGWPVAGNVVFAFRDANLSNNRALQQWYELGRAQSIAELQDALELLGIPWVNTIAADRDGEAFYADVGVFPNVSVGKLDDCTKKGFTGLLTQQGLPTLDGSRSECQWGDDSSAPSDLLGFDQLPKLKSTSYVANANDSYWLSNPSSLLEGFSSVIGLERIEQSIRTRQTFVQAEQRLGATDGLDETAGFSIDALRAMMYGARNYSAELLRDDVVTLCRQTENWSDYTRHPAEASESCAVLDRWDTRFGIDSVGAHLWQAFWLEVPEVQDLWQTEFDASDPVNTPRGLNDNPDVADAVRQALGAAVNLIVDNGISLDAPWGEVHYRSVGPERIPIHGGHPSGMFSTISARFRGSEGWSEITSGNSFIQAITWDDTDCPVASGILTYAQSTNPDSEHFADMTRLYSAGEWIDLPFCDADIEAQVVRGETFTE